MRMIGLMKELEYGAESDLLTIRELRNKLPKEAIDAIALYLDSGIGVVDVMEASQDPLDTTVFIPGGPSLVSDGFWVWRKDLSYFVREYRVGLTQEFVRYVLAEDRPALQSEDSVILKWREAQRTYENARTGK